MPLFGVALVLALVVASPAQAAPAIPEAMSAGPADLISSPGRGAVVKRSPVAVTIKQPAGAKLTVRLGDRDVTRRFSTEGGRLTASLTSSDGVQPGANHLYVLAKRPGKRLLTSSRTFHLVRLSNSLADLDLDPDVTPDAQVDIATGGGHLAAARRVRTVRILLNGRRIERYAETKQTTRHELSLSVAHGLHYGVNRLRVKVVEPEAGRYAEIHRRFRVPRSTPLPNAGLDRSGHPGMRLRLGGKARAAEGGDLSYDWEIVEQPEGSNPRLKGRGKARPTLIPDEPGSYRVRQEVSESGASSRASHAARAVTDEVGATVTPPTNLVEISADATPSATRGIKLGDTFYPHPGVGASFQWLTVDRATLEPTLTGNSWCCDGSDEHSLDKLSEQLSCDNTPGTAGLDQLVILTLPPNQQVLPGDSDDQFNAALNALGVDPLPAGLINDPAASETVVGVPCSGAGSGWLKRRGTGDSGLAPVGYLMPDGLLQGDQSLQLRFQPERLAYDTSSARTESTNEMSFNGQTVAGHISPQEAGFHVVEIDPRNLHVVDNNSYATNSQNPTAAISAMANAINGARERGNYVAVQNIGRVQPDNYNWYEAGDAIEAMGANPDMFNRVNGSYAFFGGPPLGRGEVRQSSSVNVVDPTTSPPTMESGELRGRVRIGHDGYFVPAVSGTPDPRAGGLPESIYDIVFAAPQDWPAYDKNAMTHVTQNLQRIGQNAPFEQYGSDLRRAYADKPSQVWSSGVETSLLALAYPGDGNTCAQGAGKPTKDPGFTREAFCDLVGQLKNEFNLLDDTQTLFDDYKKALTLSSGTQGADLETIGKNIETAVQPPADDSIVSSVLFFIQAVADIGTEVAETSSGLGLAAGFGASLFDMGTTAAATSNGTPVSDTVSDKVEELSSRIGATVTNSMTALDGIRAVAVSDWGKLQALAGMYTSVTAITPEQFASTFTTAANGYFSSTLVPLAYSAWRLPSGDDVYSCIPIGYTTFNIPFADAPKSTWLEFIDDYDRDPPIVNTLVMVETDEYAKDWAPGTITGPMFNPVSQGGYGLEQSTFFWTLGDPYDENCTAGD